jgi:nucleoside-diphosphate-sugar epimerase
MSQSNSVGLIDLQIMWNRLIAVVEEQAQTLLLSGGLIGSESVRHFASAGHTVVGIENDMRAQFFGPSASTRAVTERLTELYPEFRSLEIEIVLAVVAGWGWIVVALGAAVGATASARLRRLMARRRAVV